MSAADRPAAAISLAIWARIPSPIDAEAESTMWISRWGSIVAGDLADLIAADRLPATLM